MIPAIPPSGLAVFAARLRAAGACRFKTEWTVKIRLRVIDVLKQWFDRCFVRDFLGDRALVRALVNFAIAQSQVEQGAPVDGALDVVRRASLRSSRLASVCARVCSLLMALLGGEDPFLVRTR